MTSPERPHQAVDTFLLSHQVRASEWVPGRADDDLRASAAAPDLVNPLVGQYEAELLRLGMVRGNRLHTLPPLPSHSSTGYCSAIRWRSCSDPKHWEDLRRHVLGTVGRFGNVMVRTRSEAGSSSVCCRRRRDGTGSAAICMGGASRNPRPNGRHLAYSHSQLPGLRLGISHCSDCEGSADGLVDIPSREVLPLEGCPHAQEVPSRVQA